MLTDIALIVLFALILNFLFLKIQLPGILGMIITGVILGPSLLNLIDASVIDLLREFKTVALIVILIRAGLGIKKSTLNMIGGPAIRMGFVPCVIEGVTVLILSHYILGFSIIEAGMLGFIFAAVSPAVVVPSMLALKDKGFGKNKEVPTLVLAGASVDDVFAITIFGVFTGLATGTAVNVPYLIVSVPMGIILGALIGAGLGYLLVWYFKKVHIRDTKKVIIFMIFAVAFYEFTELEAVKHYVHLAGLLGIMAIGFVILDKYPKLANRLAVKFNKVWVLAEILLFVYIGAELDISNINGQMMGVGLLILFIGLLLRSGGVWLSLIGSNLNAKEKLFCMIAYWPKATVQAAIGAVPLTLIQEGVITNSSIEAGQTILALAVLSIVVSAPLGAIGISLTGKRLLTQDVN
ncbi:MAG TPA: potassium transporter [Bacteroidales bacterium]|nr:potassium transporter [Bacteroidales bacterium]